MPFFTSQHIARLYDSFSKTEVTFNAQVIIASGLLTTEVRLTVGEERFPCVLYACSMKGARVIAEIGEKASGALKRSNNLVSLHLAFRQKDEHSAITFFVSAKLDNLAEYNPQKPSVRFATLTFTQRPSDSLIGILGSLLEINANSVRRREERIVLTPESMKKIGLESKESCVAIGGSPRRCMLRDLSFSGAKILLPTTGTLHEQEPVNLKLSRCEHKDDTVLGGSIVRVEDVAGHSDLVALSIRYSSEPPISYKQRLNGFFAAAGTQG
jgi:hypothetical protein